MSQKTVKDSVFSFWQWFEGNHELLEKMIKEQRNLQAAQYISHQLASLRLPYICQVGLEEDTGRFCLSLRSNGNKTIQFICHFWKEQAPASLLSGWNFSPFHPALRAPEAIPLLMDGVQYHPEQCRILCYTDMERQKFNLQVFSPEFISLPENSRIRLIFLMLYLFLGEALSEIYLGAVEALEKFPAIPMAGGEELDFPSLAEKIRGCHEELGWPWVSDPTQICFGYQITREKGPSPSPREDIVMGFTRHPHLLDESYSTADELHSTGGEYGYFYYDNGQIPEEDQLSFRDDLLHKIEQILDLYGIGYVIGAATGLIWSYLDVIIFDFPTFQAVFRNPEQLLGFPLNFHSFLHNKKLQ